MPLFLVGFGITLVDFDVVWRYFSWTNQTLATIVLWTITAYLVKINANRRIALIPALFMTFVCSSFIFVSNQFLGMGSTPLAYGLGAVAALVIGALMHVKLGKKAD